jgi:hypothetical protein
MNEGIQMSLSRRTVPVPNRQDSLIRGMAGRVGMKAWSLSDTVCVLKNFARREASKTSAD